MSIYLDKYEKKPNLDIVIKKIDIFSYIDCHIDIYSKADIQTKDIDPSNRKGQSSKAHPIIWTISDLEVSSHKMAFNTLETSSKKSSKCCRYSLLNKCI